MRQKTVRRLRNEAIHEMDRIGRKTATYPVHSIGKHGLISGGVASNPYKNFIRNYRRENR